jgi:hypothetical protein
MYDTSPKSPSNEVWTFIHDAMSRELGLVRLGKGGDAYQECCHFVQTYEPLPTLDIIEISARVIDRVVRKWTEYQKQIATVTQSADSALDELNTRFREHGLGYQYEGGDLVQIDSQYIHAEVVVPAIHLLNDLGFRGPSDEFLKAHAHYRQANYKESIAEALKAFESTMKAVADKKGWDYPPTATAKVLIDVMLERELIPTFLTSHLTSLRSLLESGLPTVRNKLGGHGQGAEEIEVPGYIAAYALHIAASNIVLLVKAYSED